MPKESNVILLYGDDEFTIAQRLKALDAMFASPSEAEMNRTRLDAATMSDEDLNNAVNSMPFMAKQRLVQLANPSRRYVGPRARSKGRAQPDNQTEDRDAAPIEREASAGTRTQGRDKFLEFLENVPATTRLVMTEFLELRTRRDNEAAERHWLVKWIRKAGQGLERYALPEPREMEDWLVNNAKAQSGSLSTGAARRLAELVGSDTRQAAQEVAKLLAYVNWSRPVETADVEAVSVLTAEPDIFAMVDAMAEGRVGPAQGLLHRLLESQEAFSTWGMIIRQFRLVLLAREVIDRGGGQDEAAQALGVHPYVAGKAVNQARRFTLTALEQIYHRLLEIDEAAKTGRMPLELGMDLLVVELAS
jgi:DNA polymerase-3 subunit delta